MEKHKKNLKFPFTIKRFFKLKQKWLEEVKGDRVKYGELKESYVREILRRAASKK